MSHNVANPTRIFIGLFNCMNLLLWMCLFRLAKPLGDALFFGVKSSRLPNDQRLRLANTKMTLMEKTPMKNRIDKSNPVIAIPLPLSPLLFTCTRLITLEMKAINVVATPNPAQNGVTIMKIMEIIEIIDTIPNTILVMPLKKLIKAKTLIFACGAGVLIVEKSGVCSDKIYSLYGSPD